MPTITLRPVAPTDLDAFFEHRRDPAAQQMAAFLARDPDDREVFDAHWRGVLSDPAVIVRSVLVDGQLAGHVTRFWRGDDAEVGYWYHRAFWGRGVATVALRALIAELPERPLWARAVADNHGSLGVLAKCGFVLDRVERDFAEARGVEVDEHVLRLD